MKWPEQQVRILEDAWREFLADCGASLADIREAYKDSPPLKVMYATWARIQYDLTCDDEHPAFQEHGRKRRVTYQPGFELYPPGCNEDHFKTVLKHVGRRVGLLD